MKKIFTLLLFAFFLSVNSFAQKKTQLDINKQRADKEFGLYKFRAAADLYLSADTTNIDVISRLGQAYKSLRFYRDAEYWMNKQIKLNDQNEQLWLDYAETLSNNGKYIEADSWYAKYAAKHPQSKRAINNQNIFKQLHALKSDSANWTITFPSFNTSKDEFSPIFFKRGLIFSSNRDQNWGVKTTFGWTETPFTDLYMLSDTAAVKYYKPGDYFSDSSLLKNGKIKDLKLPKTINDNRVLGDASYPKNLYILDLKRDSTGVKILSGGLNTSMHDGPITTNSEESFIFYNRNQTRKSTENGGNVGINKLEIYSAKYVGGKWFDVEPFPYNNPEYSTAHPALSPDGNTLFFVSDMPGGFGGKDLYYSVKEGNDWSKPVNLGPEINTDGDEAFPYVAPDGTFFFSSNGHAGLGGLDIFKVQLKNFVPISKIENLGYPVNSTKDDFGFIINITNKFGYFSSNRYGTDDIFKFNYHPIVLKLEGKIYTVLASGTKISVPNAKVLLNYDSKIDTTFTNSVGDYQFNLSTNTQYTIQASAANFNTPAIEKITTEGINKSTTLVKDLMLISPPQVVVAETKTKPLTECEKIAKIFKVENIYYDLDKFNIRPDAVAPLEKLVGLLKKYPTLKVMIASHTDTRASLAYNERLSNNRSNSVIKYLTAKGIDKSRYSAQYFGKRKLVNGCSDGVDCDEYMQQQNRRTEFYLIYNGKNINIDCKL